MTQVWVTVWRSHIHLHLCQYLDTGAYTFFPLEGRWPPASTNSKKLISTSFYKTQGGLREKETLLVVAHLRMFPLQNHIKAGKPTMDLAGNQSSAGQSEKRQVPSGRKPFYLLGPDSSLRVDGGGAFPKQQSSPEVPSSLREPPT